MAVRGFPVLLASALAFTLAFALTLSACGQGSRTPDEPRVEPPAKRPAGFPFSLSQPATLDRSRRLFLGEGLDGRQGETEWKVLESEAEMKRLWDGARFPKDTVRGKLGFIAYKPSKNGGEFYALYENGIVLHETWYQRGKRLPGSMTKPTIEPTSGPLQRRGGRKGSRSLVYRFQVDGSDARVHQGGPLEWGAAGVNEEPSSVLWVHDRVVYAVTSLEHDARQLITVADSLR